MDIPDAEDGEKISSEHDEDYSDERGGVHDFGDQSLVLEFLDCEYFVYVDEVFGVERSAGSDDVVSQEHCVETEFLWFGIVFGFLEIRIESHRMMKDW